MSETIQIIIEKILSKKYYIAIGLLVIFIAVILIRGTAGTSSNKTAPTGYKRVYDIPGISFDINHMFIEKSTAVTEISNNINFQKNQYYLYKNGEDKYLLFNMENIVIAAQKGTLFDFTKAENKENALNDSSIVNIWFEKGTKKFEIEKINDNAYVVPVLASVPINANLYGDFCGKIVVIEDPENDTEWSLFVGVPGPRYDKLSNSDQDGIEAIINSFKIDNEGAPVDNTVYAVEVNGNNSKAEKVAEEEQVKEEVAPPSDSVEMTEKPVSINLSNQTKIEKKDNTKAYTSTIYKMLDLGDNGLLSAINYETQEVEFPIINVKRVYRGTEAEQLIKEYCASGDSIFSYFDAPAGCNWQAVEYDLNYRDCKEKEYIDIRMVGFDDEKLKFQGMPYSMRTYNIVNKVFTDGNWERSYYVFYAVPNGCKEYALRCGDLIEGIGAYPAYYKISE